MANVKFDSNSKVYLSNDGNATGSTVIGYGAGASIASGDDYNTFIGHQVADANMTDATNNVGVGYDALGLLTQGDHNVAIGSDAGDVITTGTQNVLIGSGTDPSANNTSNEIVIGYGVTGLGANHAVYGNSSITDHIFQAGNVGIGEASPDVPLEVSVAGSSVTNVLKLTTTGSGTVPALQFEGDASGTQHIISRIRAQQDDATNGGIVFETENSGTVAERMRIDSGG